MEKDPLEGKTYIASREKKWDWSPTSPRCFMASCINFCFMLLEWF